MEKINNLGVQVLEWKKRSECGEVCGMFGCGNIPTISCPHCGNWYCEEHSHMHFHVV